MRSSQSVRFKRVLSIILISLLLSCGAAYAAVEIRPSIGAQVAVYARNLFGPRAVAQLEALVFQIQDNVKLWQYGAGSAQVEAPWGSAAGQLGPAPTSPGEASLTHAETQPPLQRSPATGTPAFREQTETPQGHSPEETATPEPTPPPYVWQLAPLAPLGSLEGEGEWQPYLHDGEGRAVGTRTYLQPDPERPYTVVAIVAFDLSRTQLRFKLGFNEPSLPDGPRGDGLIPEASREEGILLAAFNGGFRAANGMFGAMSDGIVALPPRGGLATAGIYRNGEIRIGNWGEEITESPELQAWRQNAQLILQDGEISPKVYNDSITDWGASISNQIVTRRSGLGLDREGNTLYYFAGPSLSMPALAEAMLAVGVHDGMLLDINNFWVHFTAIHFEEGVPVVEPLLPEDMIDQIDRYLGPSPADFFYVTARENDGL